VVFHDVYGVATISRLLKIIGLFCRIQSLLQGSLAKETYNLKEPTSRSHPIAVCLDCILVCKIVCLSSGSLCSSVFE